MEPSIQDYWEDAINTMALIRILKPSRYEHLVTIFWAQAKDQFIQAEVDAGLRK